MRPCGEDRAGKTLRQPCLDVPFVRGRPLRQDACDVFGRRRGCGEVARPRGVGACLPSLFGCLRGSRELRTSWAERSLEGGVHRSLGLAAALRLDRGAWRRVGPGGCQPYIYGSDCRKFSDCHLLDQGKSAEEAGLHLSRSGRTILREVGYGGSRDPSLVLQRSRSAGGRLPSFETLTARR